MDQKKCRTLEISLISANNLLDVRCFSSMKVYARVSIRGIAGSTKTTVVDKKGKTNPYWNSKFTFTINEANINNGEGIVDIVLYCHRSMEHDDKYVGEVNLSLKDCFNEKLSTTEGVTSSVNVVREDLPGIFGTLDVSYVFGETFTVEVEKSYAKKAAKNSQDDLLYTGVVASVVDAVCTTVISIVGSIPL